MVAEAEDSGYESFEMDRPVLATENLVMRAPQESDIAHLVALADNHHVAQMLARMPHPYGEAEARAYATEAAHALVDLAFRNTAISVLHASCRVINPASRRVIHKCGFQYAGQGMLNSIVAGQVPVERYRLDRKTWVSLRTWARS